MDKLRQAEMCDLVMEKFRGNKSYYWNSAPAHGTTTVHDKEFYESISSDFSDVENMIYLLVSLGYLEDTTLFSTYRGIKLSHKGFAWFANKEHESFVKQYHDLIEEKENDKLGISYAMQAAKWARWAVIIAIIGILITIGIEIYHNFNGSK